MIINDIQKNKIKSNIIEELIQAGIEPTIKEINNRLNDYLLNYSIGDPHYNILEIFPHTQSNIEKWNKAMNDIYVDTNTMFEAISSLKNNIFTREDLIDTSIKKAQDDVKKLNLRIESFKKVLSNNEVYSFKTHTFKDYSNSEFYGNKDINLPYTTSFIDLLYKRVLSEKITLTDGIIELSDSNVTIHGKNSSSINLIGNISNVISTLNKSSVLVKQSCKDVNENAIIIQVVLKEPTEISTISLDIKSLNNINGELYIIDKEGYMEKLYAQTFIDFAEWNFQRKEINGFNIVLNKEVADEFDTVFTFNYIINNLSAYNDIYENESVYVSKPIVFNEIMDQVRIKTEDLILDETSIQYYAGIDNDKDIIDWIPLKKNKDASLNLLKKKDNIFIQPEESKDNTCVVGKLNNFYNINSIKILSGYQQWNVEVIENDKFTKDYKIDINDYNIENIIEESVLDCDSYNLTISNNKLFVITTSIYCDERIVLENKSINSLTEGILQKKVFVNNDELITNTYGKYNISLKKGKNKVIILLYSTSSEKEKINFNFNLKDASQNIGCGGKMNLISLDAIKNQVNTNNKNVFAIDSEGNIVVKFLGATSNYHLNDEIEKNNYNYQNKLRYYITYKYLDESNYNKCIVNNVPEIKIRLMAIFNSGNNSVSPQLKSYSFMVK